MLEDEPRIVQILKYVKGPNVLNVGCVGNLVLHRLLSQKSSNLLGIDIDENGLSHFKEKGFNVLKMDAETMKFERDFDTIIAGELIEHLSNPGKFLVACKNSLNRDGRLIITTPNPFSLGIYAHMILFGTLQNPEHVSWFDRETLLVLLKRHEFRKINIIYSPPQIKSLGDDPFYRMFYLLGTIFVNFLFRLGAKRLGGTTIIAVSRN